MGAYFGGIVILAGILSFLNNLPLLWSFYSTTSSKILFFFNNLGSRLVDIFSGGFLVFALAAIGQSLAAHNKIELPLINLFKKRKATYREFFTPFIVGYASGFIFLGYVTLFYLGAKEAVDIWMPPQTVYSNVLGTFAPFIFPLTLALTAAINEELFFRLFAVSFLRRWLPLFLAILVPAVLWGFAHSHYAIFPAYIRGIELTIFGVFLGFVFIRYGLLSVVVAHFIIDAFLGGLPLLRSGDSYFFISGILVIASAFLPLVVGLFLLQFNE
jgi:membrane protease YdiL (CAAX protease family)